MILRRTCRTGRWPPGRQPHYFSPRLF